MQPVVVLLSGKWRCAMFNEMLKGKRKAHGFTQQSFADLIGVSRQSVQKVEAVYPELNRSTPETMEGEYITGRNKLKSALTVKSYNTVNNRIAAYNLVAEQNGTPQIEIAYTEDSQPKPRTALKKPHT